MISTTERKGLKKILGHHYTAKVRAVLIKMGVVDASGETHSKDFIRLVFNSFREYAAIEDAIIEAALIERKKIKLVERKKAKLLK
jgi:hypothetical protein